MQQDIFIEKSKKLYGEKFDYSKVKYIKFKDPVCIKCNIHNIEFWQSPALHYHFNGCPECSKELRSKINRKSTDKFIEEAKKIYGDKYDYSKVEYINQKVKVCIVCPKHGDFYVSPSIFLKGNGCPKCRKENGSPKKSNTLEFIEKAKKIHGDKYDYSKVNYVDAKTKVCIICPEHGEFFKSPNKHLSGQGCPKCTKEKIIEQHSSNTREFIEKAKKIHGDKYDYSKVVYIKNTIPITIICKKHGEYTQLPAVHLTGCGCQKCAQETRNKKQSLELAEFIERAKKIHNNEYDYSRVNYINSTTPVEIICKEHGSFFQAPRKHLIGHGCPKCGGSEPYNTETFIKKAREVHGNRYDYSKTVYTRNRDKVCIICPEHGEFWQEAASHLCGTDCPKCFSKISKLENELFLFIQKYFPNAQQSVRNIIPPKEIDIFIPDLNFGIEFNGLRWHSEEFKDNKNYHLEKTLNAKDKNVKLIHIFEDEYVLHKEIVLNKILHILGVKTDNKKIFGRKCEVKEINVIIAKKFLNENHIQGYGNSSVNIGAFFNNELVGVMSFKRERKNTNNWELNRFASKINYVCSGVGGKLLKYFIKNYKPDTIKSFADRRWTINEDNNFYTKNNFKFDSFVPPTYTYYNSNIDAYKRIHKFNFRKKIIEKRYHIQIENLTEEKLANSLGYHKIYDCGLIKYVWKKPLNNK